MLKKFKFAILTFALTGVVAASAAMSACNIKTSHPGAKITVNFNEVSYEIDYTLYRNMYPQTVQHFIELADEGFYDNMIIHNYNTATSSTSDWFTGAYSYNENYASAYTSGTGALGEYLDENYKEEAYYKLASDGKLTSTVYQKETRENGKSTVSPDDALPTLIGEFSDNNHIIENNALTATLGCLKMYYYEKEDTNRQVAIVNSFDQILVHDYKYNCATSVFAMQMGNNTSLNASKYCVFAKLANDSARDALEELLEAINDYIDDNRGTLSGTFTKTVTTDVDKLDKFTQKGAVEAKFNMPAAPIKIESVKITKY